MRGFQKGIKLGGRTPGSARKVFGRWVGGLLDFKVYLSPLLGQGVRSRIERCSREGSRDVRERVPREGERGESERGRGERRERRGERLRQLCH